MIVEVHENVIYVVYPVKSAADYENARKSLQEKGFIPFLISGFSRNEKETLYLSYSARHTDNRPVYTDGYFTGDITKDPESLVIENFNDYLDTVNSQATNRL